MEYATNGRILTLENLGVAFGSKVVLRDVSATIHNYVRPGMQQGQVVGILGPSGIGKTQLLKVIAGLEIPDATITGRVLLGDTNPVPAARGMVGVVAQHYPLFAHRTVLDNLIVAARQRGISQAEARTAAQEMLRLFGLEDRAPQYPAVLSGGQRQRAAIAQQLLCSEHVVMLDEPFSGLDPLMVDVVTDLILQVSRQHEHNTLLVITHDISSALAISDTLWVLGRDRGPDGQPVPGAYIKNRIDLVAEGLAWRPGVRALPRFRELHNELRDLFRSL